MGLYDDGSLDRQIEERNRKRRKIRNRILIILGIMLLLLIISRILIFKPMSREDRMIEMVHDNVITNLIVSIKNNNLDEYKKYYINGISKEDKKMVIEYNKKRGDSIRFRLSTPALNLYPGGVTEITANLTRELILNNKKTTLTEFFYFQRHEKINNKWLISEKSHHDKTSSYEKEPVDINKIKLKD